MSIRHQVLKHAIAGAAVLVLAAAALSAQQTPAPKAAPALTDLDAFMARVLEKRNENWRTLHDYILSERETFEILGPADIPLHGLRREFHWFIRDGYLVRSPVRSNGVVISDEDRRKYEERWLQREKKREEKARKGEDDDRAELKVSITGDAEFSGFAGQAAEPRFISEAYFMKFKFEPGNYYFVGREQLDGRQVLRIEYLPSKLFDDEPKKDKAPAANASAPAGEPHKPARARDRKEADEDEKLDRAMNKTSTITMWIDPEEHQIVRFTFDNVDFGFLPGRSLVRVDEARASMDMGREFQNIWLPREVAFSGAATFAAGTVRVRYTRGFYDYRRGEVSAKIRAYVPKEPQS